MIYEKGSLTFIEFLLLILTWAAEIALVVAPVVNDQWYDRTGFWPAVIGFVCACWVSRVLITGEE